MTYWKSIYTGQVIPAHDDFIPKFDGWEAVHEETYLDWCKKNNFEPKKK